MAKHTIPSCWVVRKTVIIRNRVSHPNRLPLSWYWVQWPGKDVSKIWVDWNIYLTMKNLKSEKIALLNPPFAEMFWDPDSRIGAWQSTPWQVEQLVNSIARASYSDCRRLEIASVAGNKFYPNHPSPLEFHQQKDIHIGQLCPPEATLHSPHCSWRFASCWVHPTISTRINPICWN